MQNKVVTQNRLEEGLRAVQQTGQHVMAEIKEKTADLGHELGDVGHRVLDRKPPSRMERAKARARRVPAPLVTALASILATAFVRRLTRTRTSEKH